MEVMKAEIKINFLFPAEGELFSAKGKVVKFGKRLVVVSSKIFVIKYGHLNLIAIMQGKMNPVPVNP